MKYLMLSILTISLSSPIYASTVMKKAAPSSDYSLTGEKQSEEERHDRTSMGQAATKREYQHEKNEKSCRNADGTWFKESQAGYTTCMKNLKMMRK